MTQERLNDKSHVIVKRGKGEPKNWSKYPFICDLDFQEEFSHVISNGEVAEAEYDFLLNVYDKTHLST